MNDPGRLHNGIAVRTLDLARPLPDGLADVTEHRSVRLFLTVGDCPVGSVDIANHWRPVGEMRLRDAIVQSLSWPMAARVLERDLAVNGEGHDPPPLPSGIPVSIVVATYDRPESLRQCLRSLVAQDSPRAIEIVVVDNHPASGLTPPVIAEFPGVLLVNEERQGLAYARNAGFLAASGDIHITTDDDVIVPPGWVEKLVAPFVRPDVMIVTGLTLPVELESGAQRLFERYGGLGRGFQRKVFDSDWFKRRNTAAPTWDLGATANAAFRASVFLHPGIGLMDEALGPGMPSGCGEDVYLFYKVLKAGYTLAYEPSAYVWHRHRQDMPGLRRQLYNYSKGHVAYHLTTLIKDRDLRALVRILYELPKGYFWYIKQSLRGKDAYPLSLAWLELRGNLAGPWGLWQSWRRVRREGRSITRGESVEYPRIKDVPPNDGTDICENPRPEGPAVRRPGHPCSTDVHPNHGTFICENSRPEGPAVGRPGRKAGIRNRAIAGSAEGAAGELLQNQPLVSVVVIFLNAKEYIEEAVRSVFAQTYAHWELLLVDDGSQDESTAIARRYAEQFPAKVRYLEHPGHQNRGMSATRNLGARYAQGEYIALLDADDVWLPHKLERQVAIMEAHREAGMAFGPSQYWYSWTGANAGTERDYIQDHGIPANRVFPPAALTTLLYPLGKAPTPCPSNLMIRRDVYERIGGFEESFTGEYQLYEDQAFLAKAFVNTSVYAADECWDKYRQRPDSCVAAVNRAGQYHSVRRHFLDWLESYLAGRAYTDPSIRSALRVALRPYRHPLLHRLLENGRETLERSKPRLKQIARELRRLQKRCTFHVARSTLTGNVQRATCQRATLHFGDLRRVTPLSRNFGYDRGRPIDRYYIEAFLARCRDDIHGRVLEIGDDVYTRAFGGDRVAAADVLHVVAGNPRATIVGDLTCAEHIPADTFDCVILTQTLDLIYDVRAALRTVYRILRPGGVVLATAPGITPLGHDEWTESVYWNFTALSARRLFGEVFPEDKVHVEAHGNVLAASAFLYGLAVEDLRREELDYRDPGYDLLIAIRAAKPEATR